MPLFQHRWFDKLFFPYKFHLFKIQISSVYLCVLHITTCRLSWSSRPFWILIYGDSYLWGPINNSRNNGPILELFFFKFIRKSPGICWYHLQLNPWSVEASGELASSGVNISWKFNSQIWPKTFLGTPRGPWQYVVYHFSGQSHCL